MHRSTYRIGLQSIPQARLDRVDPAKQILVLRLEVLLALVRLVQLFSETPHLLLML
jgi:hypothetical protein